MSLVLSLLSLVLLVTTLPAASSQTLPWWGQYAQNAQKTHVALDSRFLHHDSPTYPAVSFELSFDSNIKELVIDQDGKAVLLTDLGACYSYDPADLELDECHYIGRAAALGPGRKAYTSEPGRLRSYTLGNSQEDWVWESVNVTHVAAVDSLGRAYVTGLGGITVVDKNRNIVNRFDSIRQAIMAVSPGNDILYLTLDLFTVEARVIATNELLWTRAFPTPVESIHVLPTAVVVDTLFHWALLTPLEGDQVAELEATEGINSLILYEDLFIINRDNAIVAYSFDGELQERFQLEGTFSFLSLGCGAADLFFINVEEELRAYSPNDGALIWSYRFEETPTKMALGNGTIFVATSFRFNHVDIISNSPQPGDAFPLWFLGWIIPLILLILLFGYFIYRWNSNKPGYVSIQ